MRRKKIGKTGHFLRSNFIQIMAANRMAGIPSPVTKLPPAMKMASAIEMIAIIILAKTECDKWYAMSREARSREIL